MKAVRIHAYGGPEAIQIDEIDSPEPQAGELLVRVGAAALNAVDYKIRGGYLKAILNSTLPLTLGCDVAGTVEKLGPGVTGFQPGEAIYAFISLMRLGAFAGYAAVKVEEAGHAPKTLDVVHASTVPVAALTAWQALFDTANLESGQTVLIHAAAGGVGSMAVQLAKWKGAHVIGTASENNQEYLAALGVDEPIDYRKTRFEDEVRNIDVVLDMMGGETQERSFQVLKPGGILVSIVSPPPTREGVRSAWMNVNPNGKRLDEIAKLVDDGVLKTLVENVFPLDKVSEAFALSESGRTRGKIALRID